MLKRLLSAVAITVMMGLGGCVHRHPAPPPPDLVDFRVQVYVKTADDSHQPILQSRVWRSDLGHDTRGPVGPDGGAAWRLLTAGIQICAESQDYVSPVCVDVVDKVDQELNIYLTYSPEPPPVPVEVWPPAPRSPLPPFPVATDTQPSAPYAGAWTHDPLTELGPSYMPPDQPDRDFHRGDFGSFRATSCNLPPINGGTDKDFSLVMTWDLPKFSEADQKCILKEYAKVRGYTHFLLSIPQARNGGVLDDRLMKAAALAKSYKQFVVVVAMGGDGESFENDVAPILQRLKDANTLDEVVVCWQCDRAYEPWDLVTVTKAIGEWAHPKDIKVSQHWINAALAWWNAADDPRTPNTCNDLGICDRFDYHKIMAAYVDYQYAQFNTEAPINDERAGEGGLRVEIQKMLQAMTTEKLVVAEYDTQAEFDEPLKRTEDYGNLKGYLLLCVTWNGRTVNGGYMGGARWPNGKVF